MLHRMMLTRKRVIMLILSTPKKEHDAFSVRVSQSYTQVCLLESGQRRHVNRVEQGKIALQRINDPDQL